MTFQQHVTAIESAAEGIDRKERLKGQSGAMLRAFTHSLEHMEDDDASDDDFDNPQWRIHAAERMPADKWEQLSRENKHLWMKFQRAGGNYEQFLALLPTLKPESQPQRDRKRPPRRKINSHRFDDIYDKGITIQEDDEDFHDAQAEATNDHIDEVVDPQTSTRLLHQATTNTNNPNPIIGINKTQQRPQRHQQGSSPVRQAHAGNPARVMSNQNARHQGGGQPAATSPPGATGKIIHHNGKRHMQMNQHSYRVSAHKTGRPDSLVDRGANGGLAGGDVRILETVSGREVDISGIDNHQVTGLSIGTAAGVVETNRGSVICIFHQYAIIGTGKTIHSSGQIEHFKNHVDDRSMKVGGLQHIRTNDNYTIPLDIKEGLAYLKLRPPTDRELETLNYVVMMTSDTEWDPSVLDSIISDDPNWPKTIDDIGSGRIHEAFDEQGRLCHIDNHQRHQQTPLLSASNSHQQPDLTFPQDDQSIEYTDVPAFGGTIWA